MMAQTRELFFDAETVEGLPDRVYQAADWPAIFARSFTDGYLDLDEWVSPLLVAASDPAAMTVEVNDGAAWLQGRFFESYDGPQTLVVPEADPANPRIDRVVVRLDLSARTIVLAVLEGTAAGAPSAPALTRTSTIWELSLAQLAIAAGATSVAGGNITDERDDPDVCGVAASALESGSSGDHGELIGLSDDDHSQYVLATGGRDITGNQRVRGAINPRPTSEGRAASDSASTYPEGLTTELVQTADGWPVRGVLLTNRRGTNLTYQLLAQESSSGAFYVRKGSDSSWSSFVELADMSGRAAKVTSGSYTGDGTTDRTISLPFTPKFVVVAASGRYRLSNVGGTNVGGNVDTGTAPTSNDARPLLATNGFVVNRDGAAYLNENATSYDYFAIG